MSTPVTLTPRSSRGSAMRPVPMPISSAAAAALELAQAHQALRRSARATSGG